MNTKTIIIALLATMIVGCGESRKERAQRAEREYQEKMSIMLQEQQRQRNIEAEQNQKALDSGIKVLDILTR